MGRTIDADAAIESLTEYGNGRVVYIGVKEAVRRIEQLPSVQPETNCSEIPNNSDTINRQAVTKFLNDWLSCLFENCHKQSASDLKMIIKDFKNLPSAQPETAKRIVGKSRDGMTLWYQCDTCNEPVDAQDNYCRGCGRRLIDG